ncbi:MAG: exodeoxyribonuclease VII small subunit [Firmicutes bacterium]|nr:exodeoxyribonuclease VII small subunit [Bacillota bacterium]
MSLPEPEKTTPSFEECLQRVQAVVEQLEAGNLSLEESLKIFAEGIEMVRQCQQHLQAAEEKIEILLPDSNDQLTRQPFKQLGGSEVGF